jgi:Fe-S cluster assembly iron-binding protein IscA
MPLESKRRQKFTCIAAMRIIVTRIGCTLLTCDMYMSDLKHIHDPVLSSLKMKIYVYFFQICFIYPVYKIPRFSLTFRGPCIVNIIL